MCFFLAYLFIGIYLFTYFCFTPFGFIFILVMLVIHFLIIVDNYGFYLQLNVLGIPCILQYTNVFAVFILMVLISLNM